MEGEIVTLQDLFLYDHTMGYDETGRALGTLRATGLSPRSVDKLSQHGVALPPGLFAFERFGG